MTATGSASRVATKHDDIESSLQQQQPSIKRCNSLSAGSKLHSPSTAAAGASHCHRLSRSYACMLPLVPLAFGVLLAASAMGRKLAGTQQSVAGPWDLHPPRRLAVNTTLDGLLHSSNSTEPGITAPQNTTGQTHLRANTSSLSHPQSAAPAASQAQSAYDQQHVSSSSGSSSPSIHHNATMYNSSLGNSSAGSATTQHSTHSMQQPTGSQHGEVQQPNAQLRWQQSQPTSGQSQSQAAVTSPPPSPASAPPLSSQAAPSSLLSCTPDQAREQAAHFRTRPTGESACTPHVWLDRVQAMHPGGHHVFIDVGCNKGAHSVELFDLFAPELGLNKRSLYDAYMPMKSRLQHGTPCGACDVRYDNTVHMVVANPSCTEARAAPLMEELPKHVEVHCIEPSDVHFRNLVDVTSSLMGPVQLHTSQGGAAGQPETNNNNTSSQSPPPAALGANVTRQVTRGRATGTWHLHNAAVSSYVGEASFTAGCDSELCHLEEPQQPGESAGLNYGYGWVGGGMSRESYKVKVLTIDSLLSHIQATHSHLHHRSTSRSKLEQPASGSHLAGSITSSHTAPHHGSSHHQRSSSRQGHVTFLKIDTEGYDMDVLKGADASLAAKLIDFIVFEYHGTGKWATTQLKQVVQDMEATGYVCYFEGTPHIFKLSRGCWQDAYEVHTWTNIVCGRAGDTPEHLLDAHSFLRQIQRGSGPQWGEMRRVEELRQQQEQALAAQARYNHGVSRVGGGLQRADEYFGQQQQQQHEEEEWDPYFYPAT